MKQIILRARLLPLLSLNTCSNAAVQNADIYEARHIRTKGVTDMQICPYAVHIRSTEE